MTKDAASAIEPFHNPRRVLCIYCNYERGVSERDQRCPECGRFGLVYASDINRRTSWLVWASRAVWGMLAVQVFWVGMRLGLGIGRAGGIAWLGLAVVSFSVGMVGVFVFGAVIDRPAIRRNRALRRLVWPGIVVSIVVCLLAAVVIVMA